jgi:hypothetical protein
MVIKLITVRDVHRVRVFTSKPVLPHQVDSIVVRMMTKEVSVLRGLVPVYRVSHVNREGMVSHAVAIAHVIIIIRKVATSLASRAAIVLVRNMVSLKKAVISLVNRGATVLVLSMDSSRGKNTVSSPAVVTSLASNPKVNTVSHVVAIVPVLSMVSLRKAVTSLVAFTSLVVVISTKVNMVSNHVVAIRDVLRVALLPKRRSRSLTIPMLSIR